MSTDHRPRRLHTSTIASSLASKTACTRPPLSRLSWRDERTPTSPDALLRRPASPRHAETTATKTSTQRLCQTRRSANPPRAGDGDSIVELIALIQSSSFDRVKKIALWYYLILDLEKQGGRGQDRALAFANEVGLPRSARYAITGYWLLDHGDYPAAVSYLTEGPDFVPKDSGHHLTPCIPATSSEQTGQRALALSLFLSLVDVQAFQLDLDESFAEARVVATCWSEGIRAACC
ncbi:hypothetical protein L7F22_049964 [Adiantum nelumboides]|nr:hypothetical protein [Adiantum nelumboides]